MYVVDKNGLVLQQGRCEEDLWLWIQETSTEPRGTLFVYMSKQQILEHHGKFQWASKKRQQGIDYKGGE